ncbi:MAG: helix-turn-helix transcriptional regulator [Oceanospirillaceae bacterium]|nr:helix-turn-helix transcriptional regulator [Oceanospirillaceae bacterium]
MKFELAKSLRSSTIRRALVSFTPDKRGITKDLELGKLYLELVSYDNKCGMKFSSDLHRSRFQKISNDTSQSKRQRMISCLIWFDSSSPIYRFIEREHLTFSFSQKSLLHAVISSLIAQSDCPLFISDIDELTIIKYGLLTSLSEEKGKLFNIDDPKRLMLAEPKIIEAIELIKQNPKSDWTTEKLARSVGLSRTSFSTKFSLLVGQTVMSYLTEYRFSLAKEMLINSSLSISEISETVGYASDISFARAFKRVYKLSPSKLRKNASLKSIERHNS